MKYYAGIGSRETPEDILQRMQSLAYFLSTKRYVLRSGGAEGADTAFETGCDDHGGHKEIFLPWKSFNNNASSFYEPSQQALDLAEVIHPYFAVMKRPSKLLTARNMHQILGEKLDKPVMFVACWTKDGCESHETYDPKITGGTGSAIALASLKSIPVYNFYNEERFFNLMEDFFF